MPFHLAPFRSANLTEPLVARLLDDHRRRTLPALRRRWAYYRNPSSTPRPGSPDPRPRLAQEQGLPRRLTGPRDTFSDDRAASQREIVIENDIAWRIHAMVDFMLRGPVSFLSAAGDSATRRDIERLLDATLEASGGVALLQDAALLAAVYGHVDLILRADDLFADPTPASDFDEALRRAAQLRIEIVEPPRAVPVLNPSDFRALDAYIIHAARPADRTEAADPPRALEAVCARLNLARRRRAAVETAEIISPEHRQVYENDRLVVDAPNPLGELPVVHIQNLSQPFHYEGISEVEPLIPLQDELNTRLSDRAHRVTLQSFKAYLAKGLGDEAGVRTIAPGQVWTTDNPDASIEAFGGDAQSPSEDAHIQQIRDAMDKTSSVTPLAAGLLRAKVGQLTSENALRITLMGLLAKTTRKQLAFGRGLSELARLILAALDRAGVHRTDPDQRAVSVQWPDPVPPQERDTLDAALIKSQLGVPRQRILAELGYAPADQSMQ